MQLHFALALLSARALLLRVAAADTSPCTNLQGKLSSMQQDATHAPQYQGKARSIRPAHSMTLALAI